VQSAEHCVAMGDPAFVLCDSRVSKQENNGMYRVTYAYANPEQVLITERERGQVYISHSCRSNSRNKRRLNIPCWPCWPCRISYWLIRVTSLKYVAVRNALTALSPRSLSHSGQSVHSASIRERTERSDVTDPCSLESLEIKVRIHWMFVSA